MQPRSTRNGKDQDHPLLLGAEFDGVVTLVETTGLAFGLHKGSRRWVTGDQVLPGVEAGLLNVVRYADDGMPAAFGKSPSKASNHTVVVEVKHEVPETEETEEPASSPPAGSRPQEPASEAGVEADGYASVAAAHEAYETDQVADMAIPATKAWIGDDLARAEAVEARESTRGDQARKGILDHVAAMLDTAVSEGEPEG